MAKIEVLKGTETTIGPIGIVSMGKGGVEAGRAMQSAGKRIFDAAFEYAYNKEKQKGQDDARLAAISARDANGNLTFPEIPKSLSPVAQQFYEPIANKRYQDALVLDLDDQAKRLAKVHERDPDGFAEDFQTYLDTTKAQAGKFAGFVESTGAITSKQYQTKLFIDQKDLEDKNAAQNAVNTLYNAISDIEQSARSGATLSARLLLTNKIEELNGVMAEHGDRLGMAFLPETSKKLRASFITGDIINISNKMEQSLPSDDPDQKQSNLSAHLNYMAIAIENRSLDSIPKQFRDTLEKAGLSQKYLNDDVFAGLHAQMARDVRTRQGTVQEQFNAERDNMLTGAAISSMSAGNNLSVGESDRVFNAIGVRSSVDLENNLRMIMTPPENGAQRVAWDAQFGAVHHLLFNTTGEMPTVVKDYLQNVSTMTADQLPIAIAMYQQATRFNRGTYTEQLTRGLSDESVIMYETLINVQDVLGNQALPEFMNSFRLKDKATADEVKANILGKLGEKKGSVDSAVRKFVTDNISDDASPSEITFYTRFADDLLFSMDKERARRILKSAGDTVFRKSDILHPSIGRSRYTPERAYTDDITMGDFNDAIDMKLGLVDSNLKIGVNAFLVPDIREGSALPVYTFVDADKNIITHNGKPLQVGNQYVVNKMAERRNISVQQLRRDAASARELFVKNQSIFDEAFAP
jgi:hypothetical protein